MELAVKKASEFCEDIEDGVELDSVSFSLSCQGESSAALTSCPWEENEELGDGTSLFKLASGQEQGIAERLPPSSGSEINSVKVVALSLTLGLRSKGVERGGEPKVLGVSHPPLSHEDLVTQLGPGCLIGEEMVAVLEETFSGSLQTLSKSNLLTTLSKEHRFPLRIFFSAATLSSRWSSLFTLISLKGDG